MGDYEMNDIQRKLAFFQEVLDEIEEYAAIANDQEATRRYRSFGASTLEIARSQAEALYLEALKEGEKSRCPST